LPPAPSSAVSVVRPRPVIPIMWRFQCLCTYTGEIWQTSIDPDVEPTVWLFEDSTPRLTEGWNVDIFAGLHRRWPELEHGS
jgi:hypothetical protein